MAPKLAAVVIFILFALALGQGCTAPTGGGGQSGGTQVPSGGQTPAPPAIQTTGSGSTAAIYPGPTVTVPPIYRVEIQENRNHNPIHPDITVTFRGGDGQVFLKKILATVVRSDGLVIQKEIDQPENGQISVGENVTLPGTTGVDRVIVVVTIISKDYKIIDMNDDYNSHS